MNTVEVRAERLSGGALPLDNLREWQLSASLSSPAVSFSCAGPVDRHPGELGAVTVSGYGKTLFAGKIDKQVLRLEQQGRQLALEARNRGALLLDNEAMPCVLTNLRMSTLFGHCAAPYGFTLYNPNPGGSMAMYTIHKGQSEWEALCGFAAAVNGRTPYVRDGVVIIDRPGSVQKLVIGGGEQPYSRLEHSLIPYNIYSKVVLRDADGSYSTSARNSSAGYYGVRRVRYVIPSNEFMDSPGLDANQRIRRSMLDKESIVVTLPGFVDAFPGQSAEIADYELNAANLLVEQVVHRMDSGGLVTMLRLVSAIYYD